MGDNNKGHTQSVSSVCLTDRYLATGSHDSTAKLWDVESGKVVRTFKGHTSSLNSVSLTDKYLATGGNDSTAILWDLKSGKVLRTVKHDWQVTSVSLKDKYLATGSWDKSTKVVDLRTGKLIHTFIGHDQWVLSVAFKREIQEVDMDRSMWPVVHFLGDEKKLNTVVLALILRYWFQRRKERYLATGSQDCTAKVWDLNSGKVERTYAYDPVLNVQVTSVSLTDKHLATGLYDDTAKLWDVKSGKLLHTFTGHTGVVSSVSLTDEYLATGSHDGTARLWDLKTGKVVHTFTHYSLAGLTSVSLTDKYLATGSNDKTAKLWDLKSGECVQTFGVWCHRKKPLLSGQYN